MTSPSVLSFVLLVVHLAHLTYCLEVECGIDPARSMVACQCVGPNRDTHGSERLEQIVAGGFGGFGAGLGGLGGVGLGGGGFPVDDLGVAVGGVGFDIRHVELRDCRSVSLVLNLRSFYLDGRVYNISDVSFDTVETLNLYMEDIDYGSKRFVFDNVKYVKLSGYLAHYGASVRFFFRSNPLNRGDVVFQDFYARSNIPLINIMDARSVRVADSAFESLYETDVLRVERCHLGLTTLATVACTRRDLFVSQVNYPLTLEDVARSPAFIAGMVILAVGVVVGVAACFYVRRWRNRKELELLGFPVAKAASSSSAAQFPTTATVLSSSTSFPAAAATAAATQQHSSSVASDNTAARLSTAPSAMPHQHYSFR